jgi:hypothetical protein
MTKTGAYQLVQDKVKQDQQENQASILQIKKWTNTHQLIKLNSIWWKGKSGQLIVAGDNNLKRGVINFYHNSPPARHPGISNTFELAKQDFWWPNMKQDIEQYVKGCAVCQANKVNTRLLKPSLIPITPEHTLPFQTIAMDFIMKLLVSEGYNTILTITDHDCSKAAIFIPCKETITAEGVTDLYLKYVYPQFGIPKKVILDRDTRFTSKFTKGLCQALEIYQNISTAYHPHTDGQSERTNPWLKGYLQCYCKEHQKDWCKWLPIAEAVHNQWPNTTTKKMPYDLIMGYTPQVNWSSIPSQVPAVTAQLEELDKIRDGVLKAIAKAQADMRRTRSGNKRFKPYNEGNQVWIGGTNLRTLDPTSKLGQRQYRPFKVLKRLSDAVY